MDHPALFIAFVVCCAAALVYGDMFAGMKPPRPYMQCFGRMRKRAGAHWIQAEVESSCDNYWLWHNAKNTIIHRAATAQQRYFLIGLLDDYTNELEHHRWKRQAGIMGPNRRVPLRKEIRMMSERERNLFFEAVNSAKRNTTIFPNVYEAIANFHTGITAVSAHGGCAFHGWHRVYAILRKVWYIRDASLLAVGGAYLVGGIYACWNMIIICAAPK